MIRLALIGCGHVAEVAHLPALAKVPDFTLSAVLDADPARARALAAKSGAPRVHVAKDVADLVGRCEAALVALPNHLHASACLPLLERGCHVLLEKPMAVSTEDCDRLIGAARASRAVLSAAMVRRFTAGHTLMHDLIAGETFGKVRRVRVAEGVVYNWPAATGFFLKKDQAGGGVLVDYGSHVLDALLWWLGEVTVGAYEDDAYGGVEAECLIQCVAGAGIPVEVELSRLRRLPCTARIEFERAAVAINLHNSTVDLDVAGTDRPIRGRVGSTGPRGWTPADDPFVLQLRAFHHDIERRAGVTSTARTARQVAALFAACAAKRRPLTGPATPAVDLEVVGAG